jgi:hypothetical protein
MLFNVNLMRNFSTPYLATNPGQFWAGWHISLTTWLREFLFTPLCFWLAGTGKRGKASHVMLAMFMTMVLCGLWHGAGVMFLLWGAFHGLVYAVYTLCPFDRGLKRRLGAAGGFLSWVIFFHLICFSWILFRCGTVDQFLLVVRSIGQMGAVLHAPFTGPWYKEHWIFYVMAYGLLVLGFVTLLGDLAQRAGKGDVRQLYHRLPAPVSALTILGLLYGIMFFGKRTANEFIYFAF